jgi:hypothetical protein
MLESIPGLHIGDIIKASRLEPLDNDDYVEGEVSSSGSQQRYIMKEHYWLVLDVTGWKIFVHRFTSFHPKAVQEEMIEVTGMGRRSLVADYVQIVDDHPHHHHNGPVEAETRCYDNGQTLIHWSGPEPSPKQAYFVPLIWNDILRLAPGHSGVELAGQVTAESILQFIAMHTRLQAEHHRGQKQAWQASDRYREWQASLQAAADEQAVEDEQSEP